MTAPAPARVQVFTPDSDALHQETLPAPAPSLATLSENHVRTIFEIDRTVAEIIDGGWKNIALQFPDDMLNHAPRVYELLRDGLRTKQRTDWDKVGNISQSLQQTTLDDSRTASVHQEHRLTILADTSYGACCVDEIAAEHVDAQVVVHYGRTCLSPTARLPVIYIFTLEPLDHDSVISSFQRVFPDTNAEVILLADVPYQGHVDAISSKLRSVGFSNLFAPSVIHDPASLIPNRTLPTQCASDTDALSAFAIFHISDPPPALLLNLASRVSAIHIHPAKGDPTAIEASTSQALRRRYALVTRLSTVPIFGILINTLSVKNYMHVLDLIKSLITAAGKKHYTFVVGKVNAAKVANFSEIGGWVVIGCWESSLVENEDFWKPIITPFELKLALADERDRVWTGEWRSDFQGVLDDAAAQDGGRRAASHGDSRTERDAEGSDAEGSDAEDEPPVFDLRTGRYVSHSRPMARPALAAAAAAGTTSTGLVARGGDRSLARIGGEVSPAAEFLRQKRTWQGLGSDFEVAYQHDEEGGRAGAGVEEGRGGVARGYRVGEGGERT